jgi:hypothetical protein
MAMASTVPTAGSMVTTGPPVKIKSTASGAAAVAVGATVVVAPSEVEEVGSVESSCAVVVAAVVGVSAPPWHAAAISIEATITAARRDMQRPYPLTRANRGGDPTRTSTERWGAMPVERSEAFHILR